MHRDPCGPSAPVVRHIIGLMDRFGLVRARSMFGGHGFYRDGVMFALVVDGSLYLKVDEQSRHFFVLRNLQAFSFTAKGRTVRLSYHEAPPEALEDGSEMAEWCQLAWQAALRVKEGGSGSCVKRKKGVKARQGGQTSPELAAQLATQLADLPNLGPRSIESLAAAGVTSLACLRELGAVRAFVRTRAHNPAVSLNLLWVLEGALTCRRWQEVAETDRASLLMALEDVQNEG